jgi:hypothetical protein
VDADTQLTGALLQRLAADWNRGDMDAYLAHYWRDPDLRVVSGNSVIAGWEALASAYRGAYPDAHEMGRFSVDDFGVIACPGGTLLCCGRFRHQFPALLVDGAFTHALREVPGQGWRIVHEHTSRGAQPAAGHTY